MSTSDDEFHPPHTGPGEAPPDDEPLQRGEPIHRQPHPSDPTVRPPSPDNPADEPTDADLPMEPQAGL